MEVEFDPFLSNSLFSGLACTNAYTFIQWQDEYLAVGVNDDKISVVRNYIANQEEHHKKVTFKDEYDKFIKRYGFDIIKNEQIMGL